MKMFLSVTGIVLLVASVAVAQPPRGPGGGFRGGFGGPFGGPQAGIGLLAMPEVQKELNISDEQKEKLTEAMEKARESMQGAFQGLQDLSREERQARMEEMRKKAEEVQTQVMAVLNDKQKERFGQLRLQREGAMAVLRSDVGEKLKLTDEQKEKIAKIREEGARGFGGGRGEGGDQDRAAAFQRMREAQEKRNSELMAVLTDEQKKELESMKGEKFDFPQPQFGGPGGGGPGGGQRRRPAAKEE